MERFDAISAASTPARLVAYALRPPVGIHQLGIPSSGFR